MLEDELNLYLSQNTEREKMCNIRNMIELSKIH